MVVQKPARVLTNREACPACGSAERHIRYRAAYDDPAIRDFMVRRWGAHVESDLHLLEGCHYELAECPSCGAVYQTEVPTPEFADRLYGSWLAQLERPPEKRSRIRERYAMEILQVLALLGTAPGETRMLDYGMGFGDWCAVAKGLGCEIFGQDLSTYRCEQAKAQGIAVLDMEELPGQDFHFINTEQVLEHLTEPLADLRHLASALRPGGVVKISVPDGDSVDPALRRMDWSGGSLGPVGPLAHVTCFRSSSLVALAERAGLEEVRIPLWAQYHYRARAGGWLGLAKELMRPLRRNVLGRGTYKLFRKPAG